MIDFYEEVLKNKDAMLSDLKALCEIPSVLDESTAKENQPFGLQCRRALDAMLAIGKRDGFVTDEVDGYAGHIDMGDQEDTFGILGHLDVVPCNKEGWDYDPYNMTLDGDRLYGRGVADDKGPLLAAYYAAKIINHMDFEKKMKIRVIFGCNEENGSTCVEHYFKHRPYPAMGFTPDADFPVVYGEKANCHFVLSGETEKDEIIGIYAGTRANIVPGDCEAYVAGACNEYEGSFKAFLQEHQLSGNIEEEGNHTKLVLKGKSAHASTPELGINAAVMMCHYLHGITDNKVVAFVDDCFYGDTSGNKLGIQASGMMGDLTVNLGILTFKDQHSRITLDLRLPSEVKKEDLVAKMNKAIAPYGLNEEHEIGDALFVDPKSELIVKLHESYVAYTNDHEHGPQAIGGGTYAKEMPNCVAFGAEFPGRNNCMHQNNENILLEDLLKAAAIYAQALYDLLKA